MNGKIKVFVNDKPVEVYRGMTVKHALIAFDQTTYEAATRGELAVEDADGFRTGLDGAVFEGGRIYTRRTGE